MRSTVCPAGADFFITEKLKGIFVPIIPSVSGVSTFCLRSCYLIFFTIFEIFYFNSRLSFIANNFLIAKN